MTTPTKSTARPRSKTKPGAASAKPFPVLWVVGLALVVVVGIGLVVALRGGDDAAAATGIAFGTVTVTGETLPSYVQDAADPAVGQAVPVLEGLSFDETPVAVGEPGEPTVVAFVAHWCPHCQVEVPKIVELANDGAFEGVRMVAVATGTNPDAPNFPPVAWLDREDWPGDVLVDDQAATAAEAYGLEGYPFLVAYDADGKVVGRSSGEQPADDIAALAAAARGDA